ncbi:MAG: hypothetical protein GKS07_01945 [Nitrosopumilus sp.]|nr:MAG: hypothetical protein GKS07_01945 [Nitrosopumilus sp.]
MATKKQIKQILEVVKKHGRIQRAQLIKQIEHEGLMSHQTTSNVINEAVKIQRLFRQEDYKGKQKIVWYSVNEDIRKTEEHLKKELNKKIEKFDSSFAIFIEKYPTLSLEQKADGVDHFNFLFRTIVETINHLTFAFQETSYWKKLFKEFRESRQIKFQKLASTESLENVGYISLHLLSQLFEDVNDAFEDADEYLKEI